MLPQHHAHSDTHSVNVGDGSLVVVELLHLCPGLGVYNNQPPILAPQQQQTTSTAHGRRRGQDTGRGVARKVPCCHGNRRGGTGDALDRVVHVLVVIGLPGSGWGRKSKGLIKQSDGGSEQQ